MGFLSSRSAESSSVTASVGVAVIGGIQITLTLLEKLMDAFPLPLVKGLTGAGVEIIKMARVMRWNRKECDELQERSALLMVVILGSLVGKTMEEIPEELQQALERLNNNFQEVRAELRIICKRSRKGSITGLAQALLYYHDNLESLKDCSAKLDWAVKVFDVTSKVNSCLSELERHQELLKNQKKSMEDHTALLEANEKFHKVQKEVLDTVKEMSTVKTLSRLPTTVMPTQPEIFGRSDYVAKALGLLLQDSSGAAHIAILGPGGMGKTSVALQIAYHSDIIALFGQSIYWVPCEQATSVMLLVELVAKSLRLPVSSSDPFHDIITFLGSCDDRHLILFDGFETPWHIPGRQSEVADILSHLGKIPTVSFIITMRGNQPPASDLVDWSQPLLPALTPLDLDAARKAFRRLSPDATEDAQLDTLLVELDCVPLAITLTAKLAHGRETPTTLLTRWRSEPIRLLSRVGGDRRNSIDASIKVSLDSYIVQNTPGVIPLLSVLAMLPAGANFARIPHICPSIPNWNVALEILENVALVYSWSDESLSHVHVLSPIRSYMMLYHPLDSIFREDLLSAYFLLAEKGASKPKDPDFQLNIKEVEEERANIEAILLDMLLQVDQVTDAVLQASINYTAYCQWSHPQTAIIEAAVRGARALKSTLLASCLKSLAEIYSMQCRYLEAISAFTEAKDIFVAQKNQTDAAWCLRSLGNIFRTQCKYGEARSSLHEARDIFAILENQQGVAYCLWSLGDMLRIQEKYDEAHSTLKEATVNFEGSEDQHGIAWCLWSLGGVLGTQKEYEEATTVLSKAQTVFVSLGDQSGAAQCLQSLGDIARMQGYYDDASVMLQDARRIFIDLGNELGAAWCLYSLANIFILQNNFDKAKSALEEAKQAFEILGDKLGTAHCLKTGGDICKREARLAYQKAREIFLAIENHATAAECLDALNNMGNEP
ncbi:hypothetical protein FRC03_001503 [Tulasnella sp. 419]|nr:hypothetical protein FRC03_001503 [Tulasnella sp. 419]